MLRPDAIERLSAAPVGRFATNFPTGAPHIVPVTFALVGESLVHMVDEKPKTTQRLQRIVNIEAGPAASLLVDEYDDDWDRLWWVRVDGTAHLATSGSEWRDARSALIKKYVQYRDRPPTGQAIYLEIKGVTSWESTP
jgi:PPOX class probable F420-dependent enzyme